MTLQELFAKDGSWCQGTKARDENGEECYPGSRVAVSWCLMGACSKVFDYREDGNAALRRMGEEVGPGGVVEWNDAEGRTIDEVRELVKKLNL